MLVEQIVGNKLNPIKKPANEVPSNCWTSTLGAVQQSTMLKHAIKRLNPNEKLIVHSDPGWQYQNAVVRNELRQHGLIQSMSHKGNCLDNAVAKNFFGLLKTEMYHGVKFDSADELIRKLKDYITYYNTERIKVRLKGLTPVEFREQALLAG